MEDTPLHTKMKTIFLYAANFFSLCNQMWQEFQKRVVLQWYRTGMETLCELLQLLEHTKLS